MLLTWVQEVFRQGHRQIWLILCNSFINHPIIPHYTVWVIEASVASFHFLSPSSNLPVGLEVLTEVTMKNCIFLDIRPIEFKRHFGGICLHIQGWGVCNQESSMKQADFLAVCCLLSWSTLRHWKWRRYVIWKCRFTFTELHDVIAQKIRESSYWSSTEMLLHHRVSAIPTS